MPEMLIIKPSALRDIVHGLQVAASIKAQKPEWRISWIVRDIFAPLVRSSTAVDQVFVFQRHEGARGFLRTMREVRKREFDLVCDFQGLLRTGLMTKWARGKRKIGRPDAREGAAFFYDEKIMLPPEGTSAHVLDALLQFCPVVGAESRLTGPLHFRDLERLHLGFMDPRKGQRPILVFPDSGEHNKRWNGFSELTDPEEQRHRFMEANSKRRDNGHKVLPIPEPFLQELSTLPPSAGIALGVDRLVMLFADVYRIDDVLAFTPESL